MSETMTAFDRCMHPCVCGAQRWRTDGAGYRCGDCERFAAGMAITRTTCARCSVPLDVTEENAEGVTKAHQERCFVVGDWVRWECQGEWVEGEMRGRSHEDHLRIKITSSQLSWSASAGAIV